MGPKLEHICRNTFTDSDLHRRLGLLHECLEEVFFHKELHGQEFIDAVVQQAKERGSEEDAQALSAWGSFIFDSFSMHDLAHQIGELKKEAEALPTLLLYVPVAFDAKSVAQLGTWAREHVNKYMMLDVRVDPNTTGGCAFVFNDTLHDLSLEHAMQKNKGVVRELLNSYE